MPSAATPRRQYVAKQLSLSEGRWRPRIRPLHNEHLTLMRTPGAADGPFPIRERPLDVPPYRQYVAKQVSHREGR